MATFKCPICDEAVDVPEEITSPLTSCANCLTEVRIPDEHLDFGVQFDEAVQQGEEFGGTGEAEKVLFRMKTVRWPLLSALLMALKAFLLILPVLAILYILLWIEYDPQTARIGVGYGAGLMLCVLLFLCLWHRRKPPQVLVVTDRRLMMDLSKSGTYEILHRAITSLSVTDAKARRYPGAVGRLAIGAGIDRLTISYLPYPRRVAQILSRLRDETVQRIVVYERDVTPEPPLVIEGDEVSPTMHPAATTETRDDAPLDTPASAEDAQHEIPGEWVEAQEESVILRRGPAILKGAAGLCLASWLVVVIVAVLLWFCLSFAGPMDRLLTILILLPLLAGPFVAVLMAKLLLWKIRGGLTVTNRRILLKTALYRFEIPYADVMDVRVSQGAFQKLFGTGSVALHLPGQVIEIPWLPGPDFVARTIWLMKGAADDNRPVIIVRRDGQAPPHGEDQDASPESGTPRQ